MTPSEAKELERIVAEMSNKDYIVAAETGMIINDNKPKEVIRTTVYHKPSKKFVNVMYRDSPSNYKKWLKDNFDEMVNTINREIVKDSIK